MDARDRGAPLLTVLEVSARLGIGDDSVREWCRAGVIPGVVMVGRSYRVKRAVLERWLATDDAPAPVAKVVAPPVRLLPTALRAAR